jgi:hypothetical protein
MLQAEERVPYRLQCRDPGGPGTGFLRTKFAGHVVTRQPDPFITARARPKADFEAPGKL